ncbi:MAG: hypothetical protein ACAI35_14360 [Candidatus Methylacidiphilales bacterium]|nr:hypothetical protein [Candidatus Methylacidiphilales bacterium]
MQVARRVLRNPRLSKPLKDELGYAVIRAGILDELLKRSIEHLDQSAQTIIDEKARVIFLSNTIMQNGRLEAITLLMVNLQMVQELIEHYGHRTSVKALWTIYSEIFITAMLVDKMDEMDLDSTLEIILSNTITELPGFTNVVHSLIEGTTSALFTLRVGAITRNLLCNGMHDASPRHERRVSANQQAFRRAAAILPGATAELTKTLIQKAGSIIGRNVFGSRKPNPSDPAPSA